MIPGDEVESYTGHAPGGNAHSAVELTIAELEKYSGSTQWVDVCSGWMVNG